MHRRMGESQAWNQNLKSKSSIENREAEVRFNVTDVLTRKVSVTDVQLSRWYVKQSLMTSKAEVTGAGSMERIYQGDFSEETRQTSI